jgi:predicted nucleotidyltransferase
MNKRTILSVLKAEKPVLEKDFFVEELGLFGSFAAGFNTEKSDIDIAYKIKKGHSLGYDDKLKLLEYLKGKLNRKKIDLVSLKYMNPAIKAKVDSQIIYV